MRILIVTGGYPPNVRGGGEISTEVLARGLVQAGDEILVLAAADQDREEIVDGVRVRRVASPNAPWNHHPQRTLLQKLVWHVRENWNPRALRLVSAVIDEFRPDLIVTSTIENFGGEAWRAASLRKVPCIHILRSYFPICWRGSLFKQGRNCNRLCLGCRLMTAGRRAAANHVAGVIGITRFILDEHRAHKVFTAIPSAIIPPILPAATLTGARARSPLPGSHRYRFGYLGMITPNKGLELLAEAWSLSVSRSAGLTIAGKGDPAYIAGLRALFPNDVEFVGWVEPARYLDEIDFLVVPSVWNEPFGRIIIEAFSRGVPVLGSAVGGIPELITPGHTGFLFQPAPASLAATLEQAARLSGEEYVKLSQACLQTAAHFSAPSVIPRNTDFFREVIASYALAREGAE